jgi:hypothetical protein
MNSATNARNTSSGQYDIVRTVVSIVLFIVAITGLYYLYKFLYGPENSQTYVDILKDTIPITKYTSFSGNDAVAVSDLTGILDGGQYSTSFWVYISDTKTAAITSGTGKLVHLLEITKDPFAASPSQKGNTLLFVGLNPKNGALIVRQSDTEATSSLINNDLNTGAGTAGINYKLSDLIDNYGTTAAYRDNDKCDILKGIEYQRWILITTVSNGRTLDVYIDGKLARSCLYKANFALGGNDGKAKAVFGRNFSPNLNVKGFFSSGKFYNYSLTPDAVWALYQAGPGSGYSISSFFSNLFSINTSFMTTGGMT